MVAPYAGSMVGSGVGLVVVGLPSSQCAVDSSVKEGYAGLVVFVDVEYNYQINKCKKIFNTINENILEISYLINIILILFIFIIN